VQLIKLCYFDQLIQNNSGSNTCEDGHCDQAKRPNRWTR
jgi:hypothetical protein